MAGSLNEGMSHSLYKYLNKSLGERVTHGCHSEETDDQVNSSYKQSAEHQNGQDRGTAAGDTPQNREGSAEAENLTYEKIRVTPQDVRYLADQMGLSQQYVRTQMNYAIKARMAGYSASVAFEQKVANRRSSQADSQQKPTAGQPNNSKQSAKSGVSFSLNLKGEGYKKFIVRSES